MGLPVLTPPGMAAQCTPQGQRSKRSAAAAEGDVGRPVDSGVAACAKGNQDADVALAVHRKRRAPCDSDLDDDEPSARRRRQNTVELSPSQDAIDSSPSVSPPTTPLLTPSAHFASLPNAPFCDSSKYIWQSPASPLALCDDRTDGKSAPSPFDRDGPLFAMSPPVALNGFVVATECYRLVECLHMPCTLADVALHRLNASILRLEPKGRSCAGGPSDIVLAGTLVKMAMATHGWHISEVKWARTLDCDADEVEELERVLEVEDTFVTLYADRVGPSPRRAPSIPLATRVQT